MATKIDISKAYDLVDWYLETILRRLGFGETWIGWRILYVRTVHYSLSEIRYCGAYCSGEGIKLSPFLFILCAKGLSTLIHRANHESRLHGKKFVDEVR